MSTIASPREPSVNGRRVPIISTTTPSSSSRPSLEIPRSSESSPNRGPSLAQPKRANRAALREYYNLKKAQEETSTTPSTPINDAASEASSIHDSSNSEVLESELDHAHFDANAYISHVLSTQSLSELLRTYNGVLTDIRALDAEKKALVYDNYSKLIAATETIRKMRVNMDPLNPMASTLDPAIASIYARAESIKREMREGMPGWQRERAEMSEGEREKAERRDKMREVVGRMLDTPEKVRGLMDEGSVEEARRVWEPTLRLLERWKERRVGGDDVLDCIEDGEAAIRGEPPNEKSWVNVKSKRESKS
ncbi:Vacuolar protein sorting-associated protein 51-like protein [Lachnellula hyalina]|uniref:Vacuolar protein sorting-associated protein 51 homolog n=1 Tax=Lachnellula hyalina TaxID=1316788 RepID=A0A8H8QXU0_9HELO|nr:Vacuolar protein sorting-associated protein 51-like protein [Lachnellula hyalina]TVY24838.1 Vacuolar protein sorting-associated protein 51-like protein [Lachnellula hyalina]